MEIEHAIAAIISAVEDGTIADAYICIKIGDADITIRSVKHNDAVSD